MTHWYVLQQGLVFALFSVPLLAGLGTWLARKLLKPTDRPLDTDLLEDPPAASEASEAIS